MFKNSTSFAMLSDPGLVRGHNEDACAASAEHGVFVVCDGVGGAASGEVASRMAADALLSQMVSAQAAGTAIDLALQGAVEHANRLVFRQARQSAAQRGMATTLVALVLEPSGENTQGYGNLWLANVGDSRCYRLRDGLFVQLTRDHSIVEEQVRSGEITRAQAEISPIRNVITRAIGPEADVEADLEHLPVAPGDLYLLCSDGLTRDLSDSDLAGLLQSGPLATPEQLAQTCQLLVHAANARGGGDNITCVLVSIARQTS